MLVVLEQGGLGSPSVAPNDQHLVGGVVPEIGQGANNWRKPHSCTLSHLPLCPVLIDPALYNLAVASALTANGFPLDTSPERFGELEDSSHLVGDAEGLKAQMKSAGYLLLRKLIDPTTVLEARREILLKYAAIGEIDDRDDVMHTGTATPS